tara:strand:- start:9806 stop:10483 length:678 start_codon:yes stop_codon:yes gene_type:complete
MLQDFFDEFADYSSDSYSRDIAQTDSYYSDILPESVFQDFTYMDNTASYDDALPESAFQDFTYYDDALPESSFYSFDPNSSEYVNPSIPDNRSYLKQAQDSLYETLGIDKETAKLIAGFAGAAGDALKGGDNRGGGSARSQRPATPTGRQLGTTRPDKPGIARTAQLAGLSQRAAAAMTAMQKNQFGSGTSLADLIAGQGATTPKGQTITDPRLRALNVKQTQFV